MAGVRRRRRPLLYHRYSSLTLFGLSASAYGVSDEVVPVPDFEVSTMNRAGIDDVIADENGMVRLSDLQGNVVVIDFMAGTTLQSTIICTSVFRSS